MERLNNDKRDTTKLFITTGLLLLAAGMLFGLTGALQYLVPGIFKQHFSFEKVRPLHVSSVIFWIIMAAMGTVMTYVQQYTGRRLYSQLLAKIQLLLFTATIITILVTYCFSIFGGREYWEFNPVLALPIVAGWIIFLFNFIKSIDSFRKQPVYVWMWLTGIVFFLFTFLESYLWVFPYFRNNIVNDMTVQWKSYGSMVGSWNMLIYGSSIFLMEKISGNKSASHSGIAFLLYFTGLFNLMFNWGHHIYTLPTHHFIKHVSYAISMTELFIFGRIIFKWRSTVSGARKHFHVISYRLLLAADAWVFLNLLLALIISIPAINVFTHGTHVTVAHAMGTTIGINSFLLLAFAFDILNDPAKPYRINKLWVRSGYWLSNISLLVFWVSLIVAGILKAKWQMSSVKVPFASMMFQLKPFFVAMFDSGLGLILGFLLLIIPVLKNEIVGMFNRKNTGNETENKEENARLFVERIPGEKKQVP